MSKPIQKRSDYDQAIGSSQQHDVDISKFLVTSQLITSVSATHVPHDDSDEVFGTPGIPTFGTVVGGVIPILLPIPSNNKPGIHFLDVFPVLAIPTETPHFRILIEVPF